MRHLRAAYTEVWITGAVVPLVDFADQARSIASTGLDLVGVGDLPMLPCLEERLKSFDEIITWYGTSRPEFRQALESLGIPCRFLSALPPSSCREHATDFFAAQVGAPPGLTPGIEVSRSEPRDSVLIHPFSGGARKNWPLVYFQKLANSLPLPVEWIAGPEEELAHARRFDNLLDLATSMSGARLYIGNDSGITHLAAAVGVPVLALFGPTDPGVWAPRQAVVMQSEPLSSLPPSAVLSETQSLLALLASNGELASAQP